MIKVPCGTKYLSQMEWMEEEDFHPTQHMQRKDATRHGGQGWGGERGRVLNTMPTVRPQARHTSQVIRLMPVKWVDFKASFSYLFFLFEKD